MSAPEQVTREQEGLSSVKLVRNASGKTQIELKRYAEDNSPEALDAAIAHAKRSYDELAAYYSPGSP